MKNCFNGKADLYVYKFDYKMSAIANGITKFQKE